jgi:hypothetical protein
MTIDELSEKLKEILQKYGTSHFTRGLTEELLFELISLYGDRPKNELFYLGLNKLPQDENICKNGQERKFYTVTKGYRTYCNSENGCECKSEAFIEVQAGISEETKKQAAEKREQTNLERYGFKNPGQSPVVQEKVKKTNLEKFGVEHPAQNPEIFNKMVKTNLERIGAPTPFHSKEIQDQIKQQNLENLGVKYPFQSPTIQDKVKATFIEVFGVSNPRQDPSISKQIETTNLERYGAISPFGSKDIQKKIKENNLIEYGYEYPCQSDIVKEEVKKNNFIKYGVTHPNKIHIPKEFLEISENKEEVLQLISTLSVKEIAKKYGIDPTTIYGVLQRHGIELYNKSTYEMEIAGFLKSLDIEHIRNTRTIIHPLELDFYIPSLNLAIEFNGLFTHSEISRGNGRGKDKNYHSNKHQLCLNKGIQLLQIFQDEWDNQKDIVKSKIQYLVGRGAKGVFARKTEIKDINFSETRNFYEKYHIQGHANYVQVNYGAFFNNALIACISFTDKKNGIWEISRFAGDGRSHPGLFSKMLKHFILEHNPIKIITFSDKRWTDGKLYETTGFVKTKEYKHGYWITDYEHRFYRSNFMKNKIKKNFGLDIEDKTEWQLIQELGLDRIWDAGRIRWELDFSNLP